MNLLGTTSATSGMTGDNLDLGGTTNILSGAANSGMGSEGMGMLGIMGGGLLSYMGQKDANETNRQIARDQMDFQERMSGTAYQRAVKDMAAAGINPMLASQVGGASSPPGASAVMQNALGAGVSGAYQGMQTMQAAQQIEQSKAQSDNIRAQTDKVKSETMERDLNSALLANQVKREGLTAENIKQGILGTASDSYRKEAELRRDTDEGGFAADVRRRKAEAAAAELGLAGKQAESEFYKSDFGSDSPYIKMILQIMRGASSALRSH